MSSEICRFHKNPQGLHYYELDKSYTDSRKHVLPLPPEIHTIIYTSRQTLITLSNEHYTTTTKNNK